MKTIERSKLSTIGMVSGRERRIHKVIDGGIVRLWVGIGWVDEGPPTRHQKRHLHHVVDGGTAHTIVDAVKLEALVHDTVKLWLRGNGRRDDWSDEDYMNAAQLGNILKQFAARVSVLPVFEPQAKGHYCSECKSRYDSATCKNNPEVIHEKASEEKAA